MVIALPYGGRKCLATVLVLFVHTDNSCHMYSHSPDGINPFSALRELGRAIQTSLGLEWQTIGRQSACAAEG